MYKFNEPRAGIPPWLQSLRKFVRRNHSQLLAVLIHVIGLSTLAGLLAYKLSPSDIQRAEADLKRSRAIVSALEEEAAQAGKDAHGHSKRASEHQKAAEDDEDTADAAFLEWCESAAHGHKQISKAKWARRENLMHLAAEYRRLVAEAECEILRAKDARDRGTPHKVAPRVRDLLAPILNTR